MAFQNKIFVLLQIKSIHAPGLRNVNRITDRKNNTNLKVINNTQINAYLTTFKIN